MKKLICILSIITFTVVNVFSQTKYQLESRHIEPNPSVKCLFNKGEGTCINMLSYSSTSYIQPTTNDTFQVVAPDVLTKGVQLTLTDYFNKHVLGFRYDSLVYAQRRGNLPNSELETINCFDKDSTGEMINVRWIIFIFTKGHLTGVVDSKFSKSNN